MKRRPHTSTRENLSSSDSLAHYLAEIAAYPLLTREEEARLAQRIRCGDEDALNQLVCCNLRFVVSIARRYQHRGIPLLDLIDEGNLGLLHAARRFDGTRGVRCISYAVWWIRQGIRQAVEDVNHLVRAESDAGYPIPARHLSIDERLSDDSELTMQDVMSTEQALPDAPLVDAAMREWVSDSLHLLRPREESVVRAYFGLDGSPARTLDDIGSAYGITRERVRQIKERALRRLRTSAKADVLATFH